MEKYVKKEVFLIINSHHLDIIKKIKEKLLEYDINLNIYKKDDDFKKLLKTDTIIIFDDELVLDYGYIQIIEKLSRMNRAIHLFKYNNCDVSDIKLFFSFDNYEFIDFNDDDNSLLSMILNLKTFKLYYFQKYSQLEKKLSKDNKMVNLLDYIIKQKITDENKLKELVALSTKEFNEYFEIVNKLLILKMNENQIKEFLPSLYQQVYKKVRYELKVNAVINELYYQKNYIENLFKDTSIEELNLQYEEYLTAVKNRSVDMNLFIGLLYKLEVIRIVDHEIRCVLNEKEVLLIKKFIENKYLLKEKNDCSNITEKVYLNYVSDFRIRAFTDFHRINKYNITNSLNEAELVISLITKKAIFDEEFLDHIKTAILEHKKVLFIYLDKCSFNLAMQYLIAFGDDMYYWAYKRVDVFFDRYKDMIERIVKNEYKVPNSNIVKLK